MITTATGPIFVSPSTQDPASTFNITGSVATNLLTVTATSGVIATGQLLDDYTGILPYSVTITGQKSGSAGSTGVYYLNFTLIDTVASETMFLTLSPYGQAGVGSMWYQTDTNLVFNRNTANTGWEQIIPPGSTINTTNWGLWPLAGVALTNAPTGSTNLVTKDGNTAIVSPPYIQSKNSVAATLVDLSIFQTSMAALLNILVQNQIEQISIPSVGSNIVVSFGTLGTYASGTYNSTPPNYGAIMLTLPFAGLTYADGAAVGLNDCWGFTSLNTFNPAIGGSETTYLIPALDNRGMTWYAFELYGSTNIYNCEINYLLIAINPSS